MITSPAIYKYYIFERHINKIKMFIKHLIFLLFPMQTWLAHGKESVPDRNINLSNLLKYLDERMDELMSLIKVVEYYGEQCTLNISSYVESAPSPAAKTGKNPKTNLRFEHWLENLITLRDNLAQNYFSNSNEQIIIHLFRVAVENGIVYAKLQKNTSDELKVCDRRKFLSCHNIAPMNSTNSSKTGNMSIGGNSTVKGTCVCYSKNDSNCDPNDALPGNFDFNEHDEHTEKDKCHARQHSIHTNYVKELDLCMLAEQAFCPVGPSYLMCEPGLSCLAVDNHRSCDLENVAPLYGNYMGKKIVSFGYSNNDYPKGRRRRRALPNSSSSSTTLSPFLPNITSTSSKLPNKTSSNYTENPNYTTKSYLVMRHISPNDLFCRCHKVINCRDSKTGCTGAPTAKTKNGSYILHFWTTLSMLFINHILCH